MVKYLKEREIAEIAHRVAAHSQIRMPDAEELRVQLSKRRQMPLFFSNTHFQLWVDKLYIAYSDVDEPDVHYVYLTDTHIHEEYSSYRAAQRERNNAACLPEYLDEIFRIALREMRKGQQNFIIYEIG